MMSEGHVMEIFQAIQGEGPWVGISQIFFRLFRCNLRCSWCDTPESFELTGKGKVEHPPGSRSFVEFENPISPSRAMELLEPFLKTPHHSLSFTGGEPLMQKDFLLELFPLLKSKNEKIFLETGGTTPQLLEPLLPYIDYISMDIKLPSSTKERPYWKEHEEFLRLAITKDAYVKIVLTKETSSDELQMGLQLIKRLRENIPVILQPVTPIGSDQPPNETQMLKLLTQSLEILPQVRVVPQVHKLIGQK